MILKIDGAGCCSAFVAESEFHVIWHGDYSTWAELQNDSEVVKLIDVAKTKLKRSGEKGKGKTKSNSVGSVSASSMPPWRKA